MLKRLLTQSSYSVRRCSNEAGQWGQLRNKGLSIEPSGAQRPLGQMMVTVGPGQSAMLRFDTITNGVLLAMPRESCDSAHPLHAGCNDYIPWSDAYPALPVGHCQGG